MVKGLEIFRVWFKDYADQYVLIGGTAASLAMQSAGLDFRATKDLDVVLHLEALTTAFGRRFWEFIEAGRYNIRQSATDARFNYSKCFAKRCAISMTPITSTFACTGQPV